MDKKYMKLNKKAWILALLLSFAGMVHAQVALENIVIPTNYVKEGDNKDITFDVGVGNTYTNLKLTVRVPSGWTIVSSVPAFDTGSSTTQSAVIPINGNPGKPSIKVTIKPTCSAVDGNAYCSAASDAGPAMSEIDLGKITGEQIPSFEFTKPVDNNNAGFGTETTREWSLKVIGGGYVYGDNLRVNAECASGLEIVSLDLINSSGTVLQSNLNIVSKSGNVYTYSFTNAIIQAAIGSTKLNVGNSIYIREKYKTTACNAQTYSTKYSSYSNCIPAGTVYTSNVITVSPYGTITGDYKLTDWTYPTSANSEGYVTLKVKNGAAGDHALNNVDFIFRVGMGGIALSKDFIVVSRAKVLNDSGQEIADANVAYSNDIYGHFYTMSWTGNGLTDEDGGGTANDIAGGKEIAVKVYFKMDLDQYQTLCTSAEAKSTGVQILGATAYLNYIDLCNNKKTYNITWDPSYTYRFGLNYSLATCTLDNPNLVPGIPVALTISEQGANTLWGNPGPWKNAYTGTIKTYITLPLDLDFPSSSPANDVYYKAEGDAWTKLDPSQVSYSGKVLTLTIPNPKGGYELSYKFNVIGVPAVGSDKSLKISHSYEWPGDNPLAFSCYSQQIPYIVQGLYENCVPIQVEKVTAERVSYGYVDDGSLTRITTKEQAKALGINTSIAGPYDDVEIRSLNGITGAIDWSGGAKFVAEISYLGALGSSERFFVPNKVTINYKKAGNTTFEQKVVETDVTKMGQSYADQVHLLNIDMTSYIGSQIPSLNLGDSLEIVFTVRVNKNIPVYAPASVLGMSVYMTNMTDPCGRTSNDFYLYDYGKISTSGSNGIGYDYWTPGGTKGLLAIFKQTSGITTDLFPNEYRPTLKVKNLESAVPGLLTHTKVYDDFNTTIPFTALPLNHDTSKVVATNLSLFSPELYNKSGNSNYGIYSDFQHLICISAGGYKPIINFDLYPTSAAPVDSTINNSFVAYLEGSYVRTPKVTLSSTAKVQIPPTSSAEWPVQIKVENLNTVNSDLKIPYCWLALEPVYGDLANIQLFESDGVTPVAGVTWETYGTGKYWAKLGNVQLTGNAALATKNYVVKAVINNGCNGLDMRVNAMFGVNASEYPTNPSEGFAQYNSGMCGVMASEQWQLTLTQTEFDATVRSSQGGVNNPTNYDFCSPFGVAVGLVNSSSGIVQNLKVKVQLPPVNSEGQNVLAVVSDEQFPGFVSVRNNWGTVLYQIPVSEVKEENGFLVIEVPSSIFLDKSGSGNDNLMVIFGIQLKCGFASGTYVYIDFEGKKQCGDLTTFNRAIPNPIRISGLSSLTPVIDFSSSSQVKLNTQNTHAGDGSPVPVDVSYTQDGDGIVTLTGSVIYSAIAKPNTYLYIDLPGDLELVSTTYSETDNKFKSTDNVWQQAFTQTGHVLKVPFNMPNVGSEYGGATMQYDFSVMVKPKDPLTWDCSTHNVNLRMETTVDLACKEGTPEEYHCNIVIPIKNWEAQFSMNKLDVGFVPGSLEFFEDPVNPNIFVKGKMYNTSSKPVTVSMSMFRMPSVSNPTGSVKRVQTVVIPGNATGWVFPLFSVTGVGVNDMCYMALVLPKIQVSGASNAYLCHEDTIVPDPVNGIAFRLDKTQYTACEESSLLIEGSAKPYTYTWSSSVGNLLYFNGTHTLGSPTYTYTGIVRNNQTQTLALKVERPGGCYTDTTKVKVTISPKETTWTGIAGNKDWNDNGNWDNGVPVKDCSIAIIPSSGVTNYPDLNATAGAASCDTIIMYVDAGAKSASVAQPYKLDYKGAKVNLSVASDRWYMLSAPLKNMYSGDYYPYNVNPLSTRKPDIYMMKFQETNPETGHFAEADWTRSFVNLEESLTPGMGYAVWFDGDNKNYPGQPLVAYGNNVTFSFPSMYTKYNYFAKENGNLIGQSATTMTRDNNSYRFIYEGAANWNTTSDFSLFNDASNYKTLLIGNPFMSHFDFQAFAAKNPGLENKYYIWNGTSSFDVNTGTWTTNPSIPSSLISPMQSFVVSKVSTSPLGNIKMNWDMSVSDATISLRNASSSASALNLEVWRSNNRNSAVTVVYEPGVSNDYNGSKDAYTLFSNKETKPAVVYVAGEKATSIRTVGDLTKPLELGIRTTEKGKLSFKLTNYYTMGQGITVYLEDRLTQTMTNLSKNPVYEFTNETGNVQGRFFLKIVQEKTGIDDLQESNIRAYADKNRIYVSSDLADPIREIEIYNVQGQRLYYQNNVNSSSYFVDMAKVKQVILIKVHTDHKQKNVKLLLN